MNDDLIHLGLVDEGEILLDILEGENAIRGYRGRIIVRDRAALEAFAGDTYSFAEAEYRRLIC
jgi:hypothetical protein